MEGDGFIVQAPEWSQQLKYLEICRVCLSNQQLKQSRRCWRESCGFLDSATSFTEFSILGIPAPCAALALRKSISWDSTKTPIKTPINQINRSKAKLSLGYITLLLFFFNGHCGHWYEAQLLALHFAPLFTHSFACCSRCWMRWVHSQPNGVRAHRSFSSSNSYNKHSAVANWNTKHIEIHVQIHCILLKESIQCHPMISWITSNCVTHHVIACVHAHGRRIAVDLVDLAHLSQVCLSHLTSPQSPLARQPTVVIYMAWLWWNSDDVCCIPTEHRCLELGLILTWRPGLPLDLGVCQICQSPSVNMWMNQGQNPNRSRWSAWSRV